MSLKRVWLACLPIIGGCMATTPLSSAKLQATAAAANAASRMERATCTEFVPGQIWFAGPTDEQLVECVGRYRERQAMTMIITSPGGDVMTAMDAADIVKPLGWTAVVRGRCASSCANYILPVMRRVVVEPYSAIMLHGGPVPETWEDFSAEFRLSLTKHLPDITESQANTLTEATYQQLLRIVERHKNFTVSNRVCGEWYSLSSFDNARSADERNWFVAPDSDFFKSCISNVSLENFWFPKTKADKDDLEGALGGNVHLIYEALL